LDQGSNPWACGIENTVKTLNEGLSQLAEYRQNVVQCIAGISGCLAHNIYTEQIEAALKDYCPNALLLGDLPTSFRAAIDKTSGIIAIAGSGSSAVQFFSDGSHYVYDASFVGGRDLGYQLAKAYERGAIGEAGRHFLEQAAPVLAGGELKTIAEHYHNSQLRHVAARIAKVEPGSPTFQDLKIWIDSAADRWSFKLYGIINKYFQKEPQATTAAVVLNGSFWGLEYLRKAVTSTVIRDFDNVDFIYQPDVKPVYGALKLAREAYLARKT
jgi:N-acetylglucosamine kinase-like BadF-type ATPase